MFQKAFGKCLIALQGERVIRNKLIGLELPTEMPYVSPKQWSCTLHVCWDIKCTNLLCYSQYMGTLVMVKKSETKLNKKLFLRGHSDIDLRPT